MKSYKNLKIFITGINGFKGTWLALFLKKCGAKVSGIGLKEDNSEIFKKLLSKKIDFEHLNILNKNELEQIIKKKKPDIIFHLAAQSIVSESYENPINTFQTNVIGSANILEITKNLNIPALVYITSDKCYLNKETYKPYKESDELGGIDFYSSSKACAELVFNSYFHNFYKMNKYLSIASTRAGNVIGGGDLKPFRIVPDIYRSLANKKNKVKEIILRNPKSIRPWQHVLEPITGYMTLGLKLLNNELSSDLIPNWNFGPDKVNCKTVEILTKNFIKNFDKDLKVKVKVNKNKKTFYETKLLFLSNSKAKKELKWKPLLNFNDTVKFTSEWYCKNLMQDFKKIEKETDRQILYFNDFYHF